MGPAAHRCTGVGVDRGRPHGRHPDVGQPPNRRPHPGQRCAGAGLRAVLHDVVHHFGPVQRQRIHRPDSRAGHGRVREHVLRETERDHDPGPQAEPTTGSVVAAGVQRWNDNGSADVLVATKITSKSPDGKSTIESGNRWVATAIKEGQQWKISQLIQVI